MELEHFSHLHPLILKEQLECNGEQVVCSGCDEPISGLCYSCSSCYFFLHKGCGELPQEINTHLHRDHPLSLLAKPSSVEGRYYCNVCNKILKCFVYHCSLCKFDLDVKCALPPCLSEADSQGHQFKCLVPSIPMKPFSFTCSACGEDEENFPYLCTLCLIMVHKRCISLPHTIRMSTHNHRRIVHTYVLGQIGSVKQFCGNCREEVRAGFGGYQCSDCEFVAHAGCGFNDSMTESDSHEEQERSADELAERAFYFLSETKGKDTVTAVIKHLSHQHNLILINEIKRDLNCDGCMFPIFPPYFGCAECDFCLDIFCIELLRKKLFPVHQVPLSLTWKACTSDELFRCYACKQYHHGFSYRLSYYNASYDVRCGDSLKDFIEHEGHEHPLFLIMQKSSYGCSSCGNTEGATFMCTECRFTLDMKCANLPYKAWHKYDDHPLLLTYVDPNTYQFYCQICEKERDPKLWFYRCNECDFDAHPQCVLGKYPYIKLGSTYKYKFHSHPLTLVNKVEDYPACHTCDEPCDGLALECMDSHCDFIIHRERRSCMRLTDSDDEVA